MTVEIKSTKNASDASDRNPTTCIFMCFIMHTAWLHLIRPTVIQRKQLNGNDSH